MKTRREIKELAKAGFRAKYWPCVGVAILIPLVIAALGGATFWAGGLAGILLTGPLTIGMNFFFVQTFQGNGEQVSVGTPFQSAFENFGRKLGGYLWMDLFLFLWGLLFVIPGIIKAFGYAMAPYILADCPNVRAQDALKLSMRIMRGHKWELFVFGLSYIGWDILSSFTCGLLGLFYVNPYRQTAYAGYYLEVREEALRTGVITLAQLEGEAQV